MSLLSQNGTLRNTVVGGALWCGLLAAALANFAYDFAYYEHDDWPRGRGFVVGHILLTLLFIFLAATYAALVIWRVLLS